MARLNRNPERKDEPSDAARRIIDRLIDLVCDEVDTFTQAIAAIEDKYPDEPQNAQRRCEEAREKFVRAAIDQVASIQVRSRFMEISDARNQALRVIDHIGDASIHFQGPNRIHLKCERKDTKFEVTLITAREYAHIATCAPPAAHATQMNVYANTILEANGAARD